MEQIAIAILAFIGELIDCSLGMGYGTMLSPILIIAGFDPLLVIPSLLLSQGLSGLAAGILHHKRKNIYFSKHSRDTYIVCIFTLFGVTATIISVFVAVSIPKAVLMAYIGLLVTLVGIIMLINKKFSFSWKKMIGVGILAAFNKGLSGGGFGPVVTGGQIISGNRQRDSIGCTTVAESPICLAGFLSYVFLNGIAEWGLLFVLCIGAIAATPFGTLLTKRMESKRSKPILGAFITSLGALMILKLYLTL